MKLFHLLCLLVFAHHAASSFIGYKPWLKEILSNQQDVKVLPDIPVTYFNISLNDPPKTRWSGLIKSFGAAKAKLLLDTVMKRLFPEEIRPLIDHISSRLEDYIAQPFADELRGLAEDIGANLGDIVFINLMYEMSAGCTSIVVQDPQGNIFHGRNLDFPFTDVLRNGTVIINYQDQQKTVYSAVTYVGYIGILTGQRPNGFTITVDEREEGDRFLNGLVALVDRKASPVSFLTREVLETQTNFEAAVKVLTDRDLIAPVYLIVGGVNPGEGAVITRNRLVPSDVWRMNQTDYKWYILETNYDHWNTPPPWDDRRDEAIKALNMIGQANISPKTLYQALSTDLVLNSGTTYTALTSAGHPEIFAAWVRQVEKGAA